MRIDCVRDCRVFVIVEHIPDYKNVYKLSDVCIVLLWADTNQSVILVACDLIIVHLRHIAPHTSFQRAHCTVIQFSPQKPYPSCEWIAPVIRHKIAYEH